ncbi:hypothetical protein [Yoonia vestfoldensis]|uniref:Uncharacterized protein n=1 Tax=Yoonia vestfoldensis TaxID=245188 RepID=A0A1Y0EDN5_9RHOB|nr:hypothetical protein [Yoonia vestfoldensis]ARU01714.1 hypothetical protein LOKVESSMR4R_02410 [Yoonia vestfoldensis]
MLRFFHSPYPTFGSYKNPTHWKIEASPYFWWWYALTLNTDYAQLCEQMAEKQTTHSADARMLKVYEDFGDTRYDGCRYLAFTQWWLNRVNTIEQRGVYLFAEPLNTAAVSVVDGIEQATSALSCNDTVMIAVNVTRQRKHIDKRIDQILKQHMGELKRGRQVRNPKFSQARYRLSHAVQAHSLKKTFAVYDIRSSAAAEGRKISNWDVAELAKLDYQQRDKLRAALDGVDERRVVSAIVARHVKDAKTMIQNTAFGVFPK